MYPVTLWTLENGKVDYVQIKNSRVIHIWCYNCHHLEVYVGGGVSKTEWAKNLRQPQAHLNWFCLIKMDGHHHRDHENNIPEIWQLSWLINSFS